jgi:phytoene dehydrogenase-like protein
VRRTGAHESIGAVGGVVALVAFRARAGGTVVSALVTESTLRLILAGGELGHAARAHRRAAHRSRDLAGHGYGTPVENVFLCGVGTHPGGEINGAPGHNAARSVLRSVAVT